MILKLTDKNIDEVISAAISILKNGGIIAYPTETFYGLGAKYDIDSALKRLYEIKQRPGEKAIPLIIGDIEQLSLLADSINASAKKLINRFWPGPLTILLHSRAGLSEYIVSENKVAVRIPGESSALKLAKGLGVPLYVKKGNISGISPVDNA